MITWPEIPDEIRMQRMTMTIFVSQCSSEARDYFTPDKTERRMLMKQETELLTPDEVAAKLNISKRQVLELPIRRVRMGYCTVRYRPSDLDDFVATVAEEPSEVTQT